MMPFRALRLTLLLAALATFTCGSFVTAQKSVADDAKGRKGAGSPSSGRKPKVETGQGRPGAPEALRVYRHTDPPPRYDEAKLKQIGIHRYASKRLQLFTDLPADKARDLPALMDQAYDAWVEYFGPLPPDREGSEFMMTGYLMVDQRPFRESGLLPENLPPFPHGRNKGTQFWLNDQPTDYYRRHLLLHEGTHCYMTALPHPLQRRAWFMEGMAELFATHRIDNEGQAQFRVMPHDREQFANLGRIRLVEDEVRKSGPRTLQSIIDLAPDEFLSNPPYAWAWALCQYLDGHPRYHEPFRRFGHVVTTGVPDELAGELFSEKFPDLSEEWLLFAANLTHGYDQERAAIDFSSGKHLAAGDTATTTIVADRGWQSSGVAVEKGDVLTISATGRFVIAKSAAHADRKGEIAWDSEPQGVSIRYHAGEPLGKLVAVIRSTEPPKNAHSTMLDVIPIGHATKLTAGVSGTLYFRVNDAWNELADNSGEIPIEVRRDP